MHSVRHCRSWPGTHGHCRRSLPNPALQPPARCSLAAHPVVPLVHRHDDAVAVQHAVAQLRLLCQPVRQRPAGHLGSGQGAREGRGCRRQRLPRLLSAPARQADLSVNGRLQHDTAPGAGGCSRKSKRPPTHVLEAVPCVFVQLVGKVGGGEVAAGPTLQQAARRPGRLAELRGLLNAPSARTWQQRSPSALARLHPPPAPAAAARRALGTRP